MIRHLAMLAAAAVLSAQAAAATPSETVTAFHAAIAAGDRTKALAMLSPQAVIYEAGHVEASREEYANGHLGSDMAFSKQTTRKVVKHSEKVSAAMALVLDETQTIGTYKGKPVSSYGVETTVLEKVGEQWLITHVHWSSRKSR